MKLHNLTYNLTNMIAKKINRQRLKETAVAERLETNNYDETTIEHLHRYAIAMHLAKDRLVLDIASGEGYGSYLLASVAKKVVGVDISHDAIFHAKRKYQRDNLLFLQGSVDSLPLDSSTFDLAVSFETIEHHDKHQEMIKEIKRILKKDGAIIISTPEKLSSELFNLKNPYHVKELYLNEFTSLIDGFFKNQLVFFQKLDYFSLIIQENKHQQRNGFYTQFMSYSGDFDKIYSYDDIKNPFYNIIFASDVQLENYISYSSFDGHLVLQKTRTNDYMNGVNFVKNSYSYKIGWFITLPIRYTKNLIKKIITDIAKPS